MAGLYLHIPFCRRKCRYCAFDSVTTPSVFFAHYTEALQKEIAELARIHRHRRLHSLFIGGGTPTLLPIELLIGIVRQVKDCFLWDERAEITVEANPGTVDERYLTVLKGGGVNRLSLGVQSLCDNDLAVLGRIHDRIEAKHAFTAVRRAGFTNINLDLMYGLPGQSSQAWEAVLREALDLKPEHLSLYQLTLEEKTPLHAMVTSGQFIMPEDQEISDMDEITENLCRDAGLVQYEISNYARQGFHCRHNINYWENHEYFACGAASVSYVGGKREKRIAEPMRYAESIISGGNALVEREELSREASFRETVIMGLRMNRGVDLAELQSRFDIDARRYYGKVLPDLVQKGLLEEVGNSIRLTRQGRRFANLVLVELV